MKLKIKHFFSRDRIYVVSGASNVPSKFGYKISNWYINHSLPVIPVNPKSDEILGQPVIKSVPEILLAVHKENLKDYNLSNCDGISISFLTPPQVTIATLKDIASVDGYKDIIKGLWFQPGSYDKLVLSTAEEIGLFDRVISEDECILVRGEEGLYSANL